VDSAVWKTVLTAMPRFHPDENDLGKTAGDGTKCDFEHRGVRAAIRPADKQSKGLLVICCPHRFIYMTAVLIDHESVRDFATALYTRIPRERLPRVFVYDNSCKLKDYILRREILSHHFKDVKFVIDAFHYGSPHKTVHNCGDHMKPARGSELWKLFGANLSAVESVNSFLRRMEHSVRNMSLLRFSRHVSCMADLWNENLRFG
jgi:hypothetical protein